MTKPLPLSFLLFILLAAAQLHAQPTLTAAVHEPQIGDQVVYTRWDTAGILPGPAGPNQTWTFNLGALPIGNNDSVSYLVPGGPYSQTFTQADIMALHNYGFGAFRTKVWEFFVREPSRLNYEGYSMDLVADGGLAVYQNTAPTLAYPFTYGDLIADSASGTFFGFIMFPFEGISYLEADAHGTLNLNGTTYNNVLRVHEWDSLGVAGVKFAMETWRYFLPNQRFPILTIEYNGAYYTPSTATSVVLDAQEPTQAIGLRIFPQPATDLTYIETSPSFGLERIEVYDMGGRKVKDVQVTGGENRMKIETEEWSPGLHLIRVTGRNGAIGSGKILVRE